MNVKQRNIFLNQRARRRADNSQMTNVVIGSFFMKEKENRDWNVKAVLDFAEICHDSSRFGAIQRLITLIVYGIMKFSGESRVIVINSKIAGPKVYTHFGVPEWV